MNPDRLSRAAAAMACALLAACAGNDASRADSADSADPPDTAAEAPAPAATSAAPSNPATAPLTVEDIERWQRGMAAELEAVHQAAAKLKSARTAEDTLSSMMGLQEMATAAAGAKPAGVDEERYKMIRSDLSAAAGYLAPQIGGVDTTMLSPAQRDEMRQGNEAQLKQMEDRVPPAVVEALRPRAAELRTQSLELAGARLKGSGM
jgi:hypothetical protein